MSIYTMKKNDEDISMCSFDHISSDMHSHNFLELVYIEEGNGVHTLDGKESIISKGNYLIVDYGTTHMYKSAKNDGIKVINCLFLPSFLDKSLKNCKKFSELIGNYLIRIDYGMLNQNPSQTVFTDNDGKILKLIKNMLDEYNSKENGYIEVMRANLIEVIVRTLRKIMITESSVDSVDYITEYMKEYVRNNFSDNISLTKVAEKLNYSLPYLSIKFKKDCGMTFNEFLRRIRIEQSCIMLKNSNKKIYDIAKAVGYKDLKYFNSVFKSLTGMTPYRFRKI